MKIVLTGKMKKTREQETAEFTRYGITVQKAVSGKTDFLVTGDAPGWTKIAAAKSKGVTVIQEDDFFNMLVEDYPEVLL